MTGILIAAIVLIVAIAVFASRRGLIERGNAQHDRRLEHGSGPSIHAPPDAPRHPH